jgi:phospholipid/cholesterol/gamma-HCH transport system substrate-binding protein
MKRRDEVLVGIFTTVALIVAALGAVWLAQGGLSQGYPLYSRFAWGQGLKQGQPVWLSGATVGFVDEILFEPTGTLLVTYRIEDQYKVPTSAKASILPNGFFGDVAIGLAPDHPTTDFFASGDTVPVGVAAAGLARLTANADTITQGLNTILRGAREQLIDSGGLAEMRRTVVAMNALVLQFGQIAALQSRELQSTLGMVRSRTAAVDSQQVDSTVRALKATATNLSTASAELKTTTDRMNGILTKLETGEGSAAKLINDPALYNDFRSVMVRLDSLMTEFQKNPRKFINLSIF